MRNMPNGTNKKRKSLKQNIQINIVQGNQGTAPYFRKQHMNCPWLPSVPLRHICTSSRRLAAPRCTQHSLTSWDDAWFGNLKQECPRPRTWWVVTSKSSLVVRLENQHVPQKFQQATALVASYRTFFNTSLVASIAKQRCKTAQRGG